MSERQLSTEGAEFKADQVQAQRPKENVLIGSGAEHWVFERKENPGNYVYRMNLSITKEIIRRNIDAGRSVGEVSAETEQEVQQLIEQNAKDLKQMQGVFGKGAIPAQRWNFYPKVAVTPEQLAYMYHGEEMPGEVANVAELPAVVSVQERVEGFTDPDRISIETFQPEDRGLSKEEYTSLSNYVFQPEEKVDLPDELIYKAYPSFKTILGKARVDEDFRNLLKQFVRSAIKFGEVGRRIDIGGVANVLAYPVRDSEGISTGEWQLKIVDPAPSPDGEMKIFVGALQKLNSNETITHQEWEALLYDGNYVRAVNVLAEKLGIDECLALAADQDLSNAQENLFSVLKPPAGVTYYSVAE